MTNSIQKAPTQDLTGKTAVITGGTTGIGFETAKHYIAAGARVIITGQNQVRLDAAIEALGENAVGVNANVTDLAALDRLAGSARDAFGQVDILFANAGSGVFAPIEAVDEAAYDKQFDVNVKGVFFTVQRLLPVLADGASIILTGSAVHGKGVATGSLYFATKAAVRSLTRSLAAELAPRGIRVNTLSPGIVRTHFAANTNVSEDDFEGFIDMVKSQAPLGREGTPTDMANAALFLASDASSYMTAADLVVDGGWMNV